MGAGEEGGFPDERGEDTPGGAWLTWAAAAVEVKLATGAPARAASCPFGGPAGAAVGSAGAVLTVDDPVALVGAALAPSVGAATGPACGPAVAPFDKTK